MKLLLTETVIEYHPSDLSAWKSGKKSKWTSSDRVPDQVHNQPTSHFGEYYVLSYFRKAHWSGFCFYALGEWEPTNPKLIDGRKMVSQRFSSQRLVEFRNRRSQAGYSSGKGEPDLFLFVEDGPNLFLEVKKGTDRVSPAQLNCLATIKSVLGAQVGIVYLAEYGRSYKPKSYELDLNRLTGARIA